MSTRVLFVQPYVAAYRVAFYERLSEALAPDGLRVEVAVGRRQDSRKDAGNWPVTVWPDTLGRWTEDRVRFRRGPVSGRDLVVVEQAIRNLETWMLLARGKRSRPALAMWGHGRTHKEVGAVHRRTKRFLTHRADWFFAYTVGAAAHVVGEGFPRSRVTVVGNTIDTDGLRNAVRSVSDRELNAFHRRHGLQKGRTALFLGGVDAAKDVDYLLTSARAAANHLPGFVLLVAGAGRQLADVGAAQQSGYPIRVLGRTEGDSKALALRAADVLTIPRGVGLVAVDSLVAGVPIITVDGAGHGPELEYLEGSQCVRLPAATSAPRYGSAVAAVLAEPARVAQMAMSCSTAAGAHSLDGMVLRFRDGLLALRDIHAHGL